MLDSIDELYARWKENPNVAMTLALCDALRGAGRAQIVEQVGAFAQKEYAANAAALVAIARMYMESDRLADSQAVLVNAGKVAPRDASVYRWLGEVLLRRGDAERAEKVIERAIHFGADDADTRLWLDRARVFRPMQAKAGARAVAGEIAKTAALKLVAAKAPPALVADDEVATSIYDGQKIAASVVNSRELSTQEAFTSKPLPAAAAPAASEKALPTSEDGPTVTGGPNYAQLAQSPFVSPNPVPATTDQKLTPDPRDVLDALSYAGIYEPSGPGTVTWDRPTTKTKRRGMIPLTIGMTLFAGAVVGAFFYVRHQREIAHQQAEQILASVESDLNAARASTLADDEKSIGHAFELDSRSPRAAIDWLHERAVVGLLRGGADVAFENGIERAKEVSVPEAKIAFAYVASFLFQGDIAGAAAVLPKYDQIAANDAWYQLIAGAVLERAGDARAADRYSAAIKLGPELVAAEIALARAVAIDGDPQKAMELAKAFRAKYLDRPEGAALVALAWGRDPARGEQSPMEVDGAIAHAGDLPVALMVVPPAMTALRAVDKHDFKGAKAAIEKALTVVDGPGMASWLGSIALDTGDELLARKAALSAVSFSAVYPPARVLAARVALLGGRLDEALKATEEFDAALPDVATVRAAVAYERVDLDALTRALDAVSPETKKLPFLEPILLAPEALLGNAPRPTADKIIDLSDNEAPWADLVAMDLALDAGDLESAQKIAKSWAEEDARQLRSIRLARLARFLGKLDDAESLIAGAMKNGTVTPRVLTERAMVLVARGKEREVAPLLTKNPLVLGSLSTWLAAYATASGGKVDDAKSKTASLDPPPPNAALPSRILVAASLGAMKDKKRGKDFLVALLATGTTNPDVVNAALALGFKKTERAKGRVTYDAP